MIEQEMFYVVKETGVNFTVNPHAKILPILWCKNGECRVFPKEVLANAIDTVGLHAKHYNDNVPAQFKRACIWWEQGVPIDNLAGRALSGE